MEKERSTAGRELTSMHSQARLLRLCCKPTVFNSLTKGTYLLDEVSEAMTDICSCLPPKMFQVLLGNASTINLGALPAEVFDVCTPTEGSREVIEVPRGRKWLSFEVISTASIGTFAFSIDEHPLWVYAVDGHYIEPLKVDVLTVANGDRYSVFIELKKDTRDYGIRMASLALAQLIDTTAVLSYGGNHEYGHYKNSTSTDAIISTPYTNQAGLPTTGNVTVFNQAQMVSFPPQYPQTSPKIDQTVFMTLGNVANSYSWAMNTTLFNHAMLDNADPPLLYQTPSPNNPGQNLTIITKNGTWVDLIFLVPGLSQPPHPIHKHSNRGFIIGAGEGSFNWTSVAEAAAAIPQNFNLVSPPYRDGFVTPPTGTKPSWLAVRYQVVNPGAFMLHCHIQSHLNGGMAMVILDGVDEWPDVPEEYKN
jgi:FtsP/CotA-like multicopper oxidase with cupredoxin domain